LRCARSIRATTAPAPWCPRGSAAARGSLFELAEASSEPRIADPDHGARVADAVGLERHRSRVVEASARTSRAGSTAFAIDSISPRRVRFSDEPILSGWSWSSMISATWGDAARQPAIRRPGAQLAVRQREGVGGISAGEIKIESADPFAFEGERMAARQRRLAGARDGDPAAAVDRGPRLVVGDRRPGGGLARDRYGRHLGRNIEPGAPQFVAGQRAHRLPRRNLEGQRDELDIAAHLDGVLHDAADVALNHHQILGGVVRRHRVLAAVTEPDLMDQHAGVSRHLALHAAQQHEGAHGLAVRPAGRLAKPGRALAAMLDHTADRGAHPEPPDGAAEIERAQHRSAIGLEHDRRCGPLQRIVAHEGEKLARGLRRYHSGGRDQLPALAAGLGRPLGNKARSASATRCRMAAAPGASGAVPAMPAIEETASARQPRKESADNERDIHTPCQSEAGGGSRIWRGAPSPHRNSLRTNAGNC